MSKHFQIALGITLFATYLGIFASADAKGYLIFLIFFAWAQIIIWLFNSGRWYFRIVAVALNWPLLFVVFLPKHLKTGIKELKTIK